jgi:hypothetical protein
VSALAVLLAAIVALSAQGPAAGAVTETRSAAQGLELEIRRVADRTAATWIGYRVPMAAGARRLCCSDAFADSVCRLDGTGGLSMVAGDSASTTGASRRVTIEPPQDMLVFARIAEGQVIRLRTFTPDCDVDAGGAPLIWLTDVKPEDSVTWLGTLAAAAPASTAQRDRVTRPAVAALALHDAQPAIPLLIQFARTSKDVELRRQAMFWLGQSRDSRAIAFFEEILRSK